MGLETAAMIASIGANATNTIQSLNPEKGKSATAAPPPQKGLGGPGAQIPPPIMAAMQRQQQDRMAMQALMQMIAGFGGGFGGGGGQGVQPGPVAPPPGGQLGQPRSFTGLNQPIGGP